MTPSGTGKEVMDQDVMEKSQDEIDMMTVMGFGTFGTTKNKKGKAKYRHIMGVTEENSRDWSKSSYDIKRALQSQFSKKYSLPTYIRNDKNFRKRPIHSVYKKVSSHLPPAIKWFNKNNKKWVDPELALMKAELNATKSLLNEKPLKEWHQHTRFRNPAADVLGRVRYEANNPELLTQAWCKFTECIVQYQLIDIEKYQDEEAEAYQSAHLCEAPGGFITSLNHYIKTQDNDKKRCDIISKTKHSRKKCHSSKWQWLGSTLNPYYEGNPTSAMINDDRFILHTIKTSQRKSGWIFGPDSTGDMLRRNNIEGILGTLQDRGGMHLITADGSVDCQGIYSRDFGKRGDVHINADPGDQENIVTNLHFAEIVTAILGLRDGGHCVLKMFTFFESDTICSLYLLCNIFREVNVFKPATSKEGNSEVYVICKNFSCSALTKGMKEILLNNVEKINEHSIFSKEDIDQNFMKEIRKCSSFFKEVQTKAILSNIESFDTDIDKINWRTKTTTMPNSQIRELRKKVADEFIIRYNIQPIGNDQRIVPVTNTPVKKIINPNRSFEGRQSSVFALDFEKMNSVRHCLQLDRKCEPASTFSSRVPSDTSKLNPDDRWNKIKIRVYDIRTPHTRMLETCHIEQKNCNKVLLDFSFGKPYSSLKSSKFCQSELIKIIQEICDIVDDHAQKSLSRKRKCQCLFDWPLLDISMKESKRRRVDDIDNDTSRDPPKCACETLNKRKIVSNPKYFTVKENFSNKVREIIGCYGEKSKETSDSLCNRILEDYPDIPQDTEIIRLGVDDLLANNSPSYLIAQRYLITSSSTDAFKCFLKSCISALQNIKRGCDILVVNFPLLTRLFVGLLYIIGRSFANIGFVRPIGTEDAVLFINFDGRREEVLTLLQLILDKIENQPKSKNISDKTLLEIVPIFELVQEPMYSLIVNHNICGIREKCISLLQKFSN